MIYGATLIYLTWKASWILLRSGDQECRRGIVNTMGVCACSGVWTHYIVNAYFCAQLQKLLNISADGEMLVVDIFYA